MSYRRFRDYLTPAGNNDVHAWLRDLDVVDRQVIQAAIRVLESIQRPSAKQYKPLGKGIYEIRVKSRNVQFRPLCCDGPGRGNVTILFGAIEKDRKFVPRNALKVAGSRRQEVADDPGRTCEHRYD